MGKTCAGRKGKGKGWDGYGAADLLEMLLKEPLAGQTERESMGIDESQTITLFGD